jgi:hypothetical protein
LDASINVRTAGAREFVQKGCYLGVTRLEFSNMLPLLKIKPELQQLSNPPTHKQNNGTHISEMGTS